MTTSTDPWKLLRVVFALAAITLMVVRPGVAPFDKTTPAYGGCDMAMHSE